jgi:hypothetical protein
MNYICDLIFLVTLQHNNINPHFPFNFVRIFTYEMPEFN